MMPSQSTPRRYPASELKRSCRTLWDPVLFSAVAMGAACLLLACGPAKKPVEDVATAAPPPKPEPEPEPDPPSLNKVVVETPAILLRTGETKEVKVSALDQYDAPYTLSDDEGLTLSSKLGKLDPEGAFTAGKSAGQETATGKVGGVEVEIEITVCKKLRVKSGKGTTYDSLKDEVSGYVLSKKSDVKFLKLPVKLSCGGVKIPMLSARDVSLYVDGAGYRLIGVAMSEGSNMAAPFDAVKSGKIMIGTGEELLTLNFSGSEANPAIGWGMGKKELYLIFTVPSGSNKGELHFASAKPLAVSW